jgi:hypothetical protein
MATSNRLDLFACGWYRIDWINLSDEVALSEEAYLTDRLYRSKVIEMQTAFLRGQNVKGLRVTPINK